jgi:hypothetical protein
MAIYPDLTDAQWQVLELRVREVMRELTPWAGPWCMTCGRCATPWRTW